MREDREMLRETSSGTIFREMLKLCYMCLFEILLRVPTVYLPLFQILEINIE
jgi:hypothetical protein